MTDEHLLGLVWLFLHHLLHVRYHIVYLVRAHLTYDSFHGALLRKFSSAIVVGNAI